MECLLTSTTSLLYRLLGYGCWRLLMVPYSSACHPCDSSRDPAWIPRQTHTVGIVVANPNWVATVNIRTGGQMRTRHFQCAADLSPRYSRALDPALSRTDGSRAILPAASSTSPSVRSAWQAGCMGQQTGQQQPPLISAVVGVSLLLPRWSLMASFAGGLPAPRRNYSPRNGRWVDC